jgi:hypothetical protein
MDNTYLYLFNQWCKFYVKITKIISYSLQSKIFLTTRMLLIILVREIC